MSFTPRTFEEILSDMVAYAQARTDITDFSVGSVARTLLEAAALEDDEQYFQMTQLLDAFRIVTATGEDLDRRLADFNIARLPAQSAFGTVRFFNKNLTADQVAEDNVTAGTTVRVFDSADFPVSGYPYTIRVGEGTTAVQDLSVTNNDTATATFTVSALTADISVSMRVSLVTGASSHTIPAGTDVEAPPTVSENAKVYSTREPATILAGNYYSNEVAIRSSETGSRGNVGTGRVTKFVGGAPFSGAGVTNTSSIEGGRNRESDSDFKTRALRKLQALSRGTPLALRSSAIGVSDPATGQRSTTANIIEAFDDDEVIVYIDDGTGLDPDTEALPASSLNELADLAAGSASLTLHDGSAFPSSGYILIGESELIEFIAHPTTNSLTLATGTAQFHSDGSTVLFVDYVSDSAEINQRRFRLTNFPVVRGTEAIYVKPSAGSWTELVRDTDYILNRGTGDFILVDEGGLDAGTHVVASYDYYTNLVAEVQKVLEGNPRDAVRYPGVKAAGIFLSVEAPIIRRVTVRVSITAEPSFNETDLVQPVRLAIESYINNLKIGDDVIRSRIIDSAHDVEGVKDIIVSSPTSNITVLENELPVPYDSAGNSRVTVL